MLDILQEIENVIEQRSKLDAKDSYVARMIQGAPINLYRKVPEEASEVVLSCTCDNGTNLAGEVADLWFHSMLVMAKHNVSLQEVAAELRARRNLPNRDD